MTDGLVAEIEDGERQLRAAMMAGDVALLDKLLSDDLIFTDQSGRLLTKADDLAAHRSGDLKLDTVDYSERHVRDAGEVAVVSVLARLSGSYGGSGFTGAFRYTRVWVRGERGWQVLAAHCSTAG